MIKKLFIFLIDVYRKFISPYTAPACRFYPTCSAYARESLITHGLFKGLWLSLFRLVRCHPLCKGGYDPVPPATGHK